MHQDVIKKFRDGLSDQKVVQFNLTKNDVAKQN